MINDFLKLETAKEKLVRLGASKLANILLVIIVATIAVHRYKDDVREYLVSIIREEVKQAVIQADSKTYREIKGVSIDVNSLKDSIGSISDSQKRLQKLNHITLDAVLEQKSKVEILEELYKSGMNGWGWKNEKKNSSPCPTPLELAESIK